MMYRRNHIALIKDVAEFVELYLIATIVVLLTPIWLPVRVVVRTVNRVMHFSKTGE